jgi:small subunit ribosomal protein S17
MPNKRRRLVGRVVSDKMQKTVVVAIERRKMHRVYKKVVTSTKRVMAHDETDAIATGAMVQIVESRPLSRHKRWVVEKVLEEVGGRVLQPITGEVEMHPEAEAELAEMPAEGVVVEEAPVAEEVAEEAPVDEVAVEEAPVAEEVAEETPVDEVAVEEAPVAEVVADEAPVDEVAADEAPEAESQAEEETPKPKKRTRRTKNDSE